MKYILIGFFIIANNLVGYAQRIEKTDLIGKWHIIKLTVDSNVIYDIDNLSYYKQMNLNKLREIKPDYSKEDSIRLIEQFEKGVEDIKKYFFQFNSDNTYSNTKIKGGGRFTKEIEEGKYRLKAKKNKLILIDYLNRKSECKIEMQNEILILNFYFEPRRMIMHFKK